jgi:hypothetical protein
LLYVTPGSPRVRKAKWEFNNVLDCTRRRRSVPRHGSHHLRFRKELTYNSTAVGEKVVDGLFSQILNARAGQRGADAPFRPLRDIRLRFPPLAA